MELSSWLRRMQKDDRYELFDPALAMLERETKSIIHKETLSELRQMIREKDPKLETHMKNLIPSETARESLLGGKYTEESLDAEMDILAEDYDERPGIPVWVRKKGDKEILVANTNIMVEKNLYKIFYQGKHKAVAKNGDKLEIYEFVPNMLFRVKKFFKLNKDIGLVVN